MCISFLKSRWLCDLVFPAVIRAQSVSRQIAECQSGKRGEELLLAVPRCCRTQKQVKRRHESGNDRAGASYRRGVTPAPAAVWSSASVPSIQTGRHAAEVCVAWSFRSLSLRLAEGRQRLRNIVTVLWEKSVLPRKNPALNAWLKQAAGRFHIHIRVLSLWDLCFALDLRLYLSQVIEPGSIAGTNKAH